MTLGSTEQQIGSRRFKRSTIAVVGVLFCLGILVVAALHYRYHLLWRYEANRLGLNEVVAVPDCRMPRSPIPAGWVRCHVDCIEFSLPAELARGKTAARKAVSSVTFQHGSRDVTVALPAGPDEFAPLLKSACYLHPNSREFSMPRLRQACYAASSDDFCWSMTPNEVRWHAFCITTSDLIRVHSDGHTESLFCEDLDRIVHFRPKCASLFWQSNETGVSGYMRFMHDGNEGNQAWIRAVCRSLKVSNKTETERRQEDVSHKAHASPQKSALSSDGPSTSTNRQRKRGITDRENGASLTEKTGHH